MIMAKNTIDKKFSKRQKIAFVSNGVISTFGIYFFMDSQTNMSDGFAIGVYLVCCLTVLWGLERYVRTNIKQGNPSPGVAEGRDEDVLNDLTPV